MHWDYGYSEEEHLGRPYNLKLLARLAPFVRPYWMLFGLAIVLIVAITSVELAIPYVTKIAIDQYIVPKHGHIQGSVVDMQNPTNRDLVKQHPQYFIVSGNQVYVRPDAMEELSLDQVRRLRQTDMAGLSSLTLLFIGLIVLNFILNFCRVYCMEYAGQMVMHRIRLALYEHIQRMRIGYFSQNPVGRLVTRVTNDIQNMNELFSSVIIFFFEDLFLLVGISAVLIAMDWKLALVSFTLIPLVALASIRFANRSRNLFRILRIKIAEINTRFSETIQGMKVIQMFLQENNNYQTFSRINHEYYLADMQQVNIFAMFMPLVELFAAVSTAMVIWFGGKEVLSGMITLGTLVAFISYLKMFYKPIRDLAEKYNIMQNAMASLERIFLILDTQDSLEPSGNISMTDTISQIRVDHLRFAYNPDEPVLKDVSFALEPGQTLAIVGPTGSGKTSLIHLIIRFYDPNSGTIRINGKNIQNLSLATLRGKIALVTQDPFLFSATLRENIQADHPLSDAEMARVLDLANIGHLAKKLPQGLDTLLNEGGASLSSGERQLISIARAIARNPELILLDEATSYVDSETETKIQYALANLMQHRTAIVVAHRLSSVRSADQILVLHQGRIIESGTHDQLMARKGFYFKLNQEGVLG